MCSRNWSKARQITLPSLPAVAVLHLHCGHLIIPGYSVLLSPLPLHSPQRPSLLRQLGLHADPARPLSSFLRHGCQIPPPTMLPPSFLMALASTPFLSSYQCPIPQLSCPRGFSPLLASSESFALELHRWNLCSTNRGRTSLRSCVYVK